MSHSHGYSRKNHRSVCQRCSCTRFNALFGSCASHLREHMYLRVCQQDAGNCSFGDVGHTARILFGQRIKHCHESFELSYLFPNIRNSSSCTNHGAATLGPRKREALGCLLSMFCNQPWLLLACCDASSPREWCWMTLRWHC